MAFFHFPMYSDQKAETSDTHLQGASSLEGLLTQYGVDIAFSGHAHIYQRNNKSPLGLVTYVTGGGGARTQSVAEAPCSTFVALTTSDTPSAAGTYSYTVRAKDAAGNVSPASSAVSVAVGPAPLQDKPFAATDDARVEQANARSNFGDSTTLSADVSSSSQLESYLKFNVADLPGTPRSAKLRLWTTTSSTSATGNGPVLYAAGTNWTESGITWNSKPAVVGTALDNKGALATNTLVEYDVTSLVTGNGTYAFKLMPESSDGADFNSRSGTDSTKHPQLVVTTGG